MNKIIWFVLFVFLSFCTNKSESIKKHIDIQVDEVNLDKSFYAVGLVYHRFGDNRYLSTNTSVDAFEEHLKYLTNNGFVTYTASEVVKQHKEAGKKIVITIDDGFKSFYINGLQLLKKYNCKATIFINTESVGWNDYLNWDEIKDLYDKGIEIGSHSHKHDYFLNYPDSLRETYFLHDLEISEKLFKDSLGFVPIVYAYPYGEFDEEMASVLNERGYKLAFAQNSGVWGALTNNYAIPRFPMAGNFVQMDQFKMKVNMKPMLVKEDNCFPIQLDAHEAFSNRFLTDSIVELNCFFNNQASYSICTLRNDTIYVNLQMPNNSRRVLLTFTSQNDNNQWFWWSKLFVNSKHK